VTTASRYGFVGDRAFNGPRLLEFLGEMKARVLSKYDVVTVGETSLVTPEHGVDLTHEETGSLSMIFQFEHMEIDKDTLSSSPRWSVKPWSLRELKQIMTRWQRELDGKGWNSQYLTNHDLPRAVSRFGDDGRYRVESAKLLAIFVHLLHGTPYIYQGEEIGMTNVAFGSIGDYRDIETLTMYREFVDDRGLDPAAVMALIHATGRDNARTPMQWDAGHGAGFTTGTPWLEVNPNYESINVEAALADPNSVFYTYRQLTRLRKAHPVIVYGSYELLLSEHEEIYAFTRTLGAERLLVILNFTENTPVFELPAAVVFEQHDLLIGNYEVDAAESLQEVRLRPYEARVYRLA
jgi:oligo-1,6-glucosidase